MAIPSALRVRWERISLPGGRVQLREPAQHLGGGGQQLEITGVIDGWRAEPVGHGTLRLAGGAVQEADEPGQGVDARGRRPAGGVFEGVDDPKQQVGHANFGASGLGQKRNAEGKGSAGFLQKRVELGGARRWAGLSSKE